LTLRLADLTLLHELLPLLGTCSLPSRSTSTASDSRH
jgi:hypothetical protein